MVLSLILLLLAGQLSAQSGPTDTTLRPVKLMTVEPPTTGGERRFFGRIAARETVALAFQVGGQILEFPVVEGTTVDRGERLAQLNLSPLERSRRQAELSLEQAERALQRSETLAQRDAITTAELEDARTSRDQAEVSLEEARAALDDATLTSPFDGLVAERMVANRETVSAGQPVLRLHDMSELRVNINIPERLISEIGQPGSLDYQLQLDQDSPLYDLEMREFVAEAGRIGQAYVVTLAIIDTIERPLLPGASGTVIASLPAPEDTGIIIPPTAVVIDAERRAHVMLYQSTGADRGSVTRTPVEIDTPDGTSIRVLSGLNPGDEIVATGAHRLSDGEAVRRFIGYRESH